MEKTQKIDKKMQKALELLVSVTNGNLKNADKYRIETEFAPNVFTPENKSKPKLYSIVITTTLI